MEGESEHKSGDMSAPYQSFSEALPIRTRTMPAAADVVAEKEPEPEKLDKDQPADGENKDELEDTPKEDGAEPEKLGKDQPADGETKDEIEVTLKEGGAEPKDETETIKKKKKKRGNRSGKKKKNKPTGFEEYYTDPPLTVAEFEENKTLYDPSRPAILRLETAVQRYQAKRNLDSERRNIFMKYMSFGGVNVGPKMFGGVDQRDMESMDAAEIMTARAQAFIAEDRSDWIVDFEAVAKGFLSSVLPLHFALDSEELARSSVNIVKNFLNYILHHDVCPEYKDNINAARAVCDLAFTENWNTRRILNVGTGDFNTGCAQLFGGVAYDFNTGEIGSEQVVDKPTSMTDDVARKVIKFALAGGGTYGQALRFRELANRDELEANRLDQEGFEVIAIAPPDDELRDFYHYQAPDLEPVGKIRAKPWQDPSLAKEDLPPNHDQESEPDVPDEYEFFLEESLLKICFVGMKVDATIWELNCGVYYFDKIMSVCCSFYTTLPNDMMMGWKKPRDLRSGELEAGDGDTDDDGDD